MLARSLPPPEPAATLPHLMFQPGWVPARAVQTPAAVPGALGAARAESPYVAKG